MSEQKKPTIVEKTKDPLHIVYMVVGIITGLVSLFLIWQSVSKDNEREASSKRDTTIVVINQAAPGQPETPAPAAAPTEQKVIVKEVVRENPQASVNAPEPAPAPEPVASTPIQDKPDFNVSRNTNKNTSTVTPVKKNEPEIVQIFCSAYIVGTYEVKTGISVKARITEDFSTGNTYILKNTVLLGEITSVNNRLYIEFKGNKNVSIPLYAYDSNKNLGLLVQGKVSDGLKIYISNK